MKDQYQDEDSLSVYNEKELEYLDKFLPYVDNAFDENELYNIILDYDFDDMKISDEINHRLKYVHNRGKEYGWHEVGTKKKVSIDYKPKQKKFKKKKNEILNTDSAYINSEPNYQSTSNWDYSYNYTEYDQGYNKYKKNYSNKTNYYNKWKKNYKPRKYKGVLVDYEETIKNKQIEEKKQDELIVVSNEEKINTQELQCERKEIEKIETHSEKKNDDTISNGKIESEISNVNNAKMESLRSYFERFKNFTISDKDNNGSMYNQFSNNYTSIFNERKQEKPNSSNSNKINHDENKKISNFNICILGNKSENKFSDSNKIPITTEPPEDVYAQYGYPYNPQMYPPFYTHAPFYGYDRPFYPPPDYSNYYQQYERYPTNIPQGYAMNYPGYTYPQTPYYGQSYPPNYGTYGNSNYKPK